MTKCSSCNSSNNILWIDNHDNSYPIKCTYCIINVHHFKWNLLSKKIEPEHNEIYYVNDYSRYEILDDILNCMSVDSHLSGYDSFDMDCIFDCNDINQLKLNTICNKCNESEHILWATYINDIKMIVKCTKCLLSDNLGPLFVDDNNIAISSYYPYDPEHNCLKKYNKKYIFNDILDCMDILDIYTIEQCHNDLEYSEITYKDIQKILRKQNDKNECDLCNSDDHILWINKSTNKFKCTKCLIDNFVSPVYLHGNRIISIGCYYIDECITTNTILTDILLCMNDLDIDSIKCCSCTTLEKFNLKYNQIESLF